ncbi:hypothetical protein J1614_011477 [Plenodomus biglobosus]|nr:hypothetical protein J1614_011477 [Plenodomus biglobosus]
MTIPLSQYSNLAVRTGTLDPPHLFPNRSIAPTKFQNIEHCTLPYSRFDTLRLVITRTSSATELPNPRDPQIKSGMKRTQYQQYHRLRCPVSHRPTAYATHRRTSARSPNMAGSHLACLPCTLESRAHRT